MRWGVLCVWLVACHVDLHLPPQPMSPEQRVAAYEQLSATKERITYNKGAATRTLILADGRKVQYTEDLLPVVPPDSPTARDARLATSARSKSGWLLFGGVVIAFTGFAFAAQSDLDHNSVGVIGPALLVAGVVGLGVGFYYRYVYWHAEERAFGSYDDDLAATLNVCAAGLTIVPCESLQQPPTTAPSPPPGSGYYPSPLSSQPASH